MKPYQSLSADAKVCLQKLSEQVKTWAVSTFRSLKVKNFEDVTALQFANSSFLFSDHDNENLLESELHCDSNLYEWFGLLCLCSGMPSVEYCNPNSFGEFDLKKYLLDQCDVFSTEDLEILQGLETFQSRGDLLRPLRDLEIALESIDDWGIGSVILVRGDITHRSPAYSGYRNHLFFTMSGVESTNRYHPSEQHTSTTVILEILRDLTTAKVSEKMRRCIATSLFRTVNENILYKPWMRYQKSSKTFSRLLKNLSDSSISEENRIKTLLSQKVQNILRNQD